MEKTKENSVKLHWQKWLLYGAAIFLILVSVVVLFGLIYNRVYLFSFFPGVTIAGEAPKDLSYNETLDHYQNKIDAFSQVGLRYELNRQEVSVNPTFISADDPDLSYAIISFDVPKSVEEAYLIGRKKGLLKNFLEQLKSLAWGYNFPVYYEFNQSELNKIIQESFAGQFTVKEDARPVVSSNFNISILPESPGRSYNQEKLLADTKDRLAVLSNKAINLELQEDLPEVAAREVSQNLINRLETVIRQKEIKLTYENKEWLVSNGIFKDWFKFAQSSDNEIVLALDYDTVSDYLVAKIAPEVNQPAVDAKFEVKDGKVSEFKGSRDGREIDLEQTVIALEAALLEQSGQAGLVVKTAKAEVATGTVNDMGITEIIGTGSSNFAGSPKNRRHNIAVGAETLNGLLIKPGEEFSLIKALGNIDASTGYLPELVIKGNRTVPEYGGGLCQIGTTFFRGALASGMPITERRNHSYRVVYYEPAGTDATIYDPKPDFKFLNDTPNYLLIETRIEGDNIYFDFWGTEDGRTVEQSKPVIYNVKGAGPVQYIETEELAPGVEKCIEKSHAGADAYFDYKVTYATGEVKEERFTSHYVPWPAKCLIGKQPGETPTTTPPIVE